MSSQPTSSVAALRRVRRVADGDSLRSRRDRSSSTADQANPEANAVVETQLPPSSSTEPNDWVMPGQARPMPQSYSSSLSAVDRDKKDQNPSVNGEPLDRRWSSWAGWRRIRPRSIPGDSSIRYGFVH